ncbi:MAG TPA: ATP-binding protein [Vicinamibacterales bacterium]|nr:ATP-binding protein [Vicinamibacterales bacterium]
MLNWAVIGLGYAGVYAALMTALADQPAARLIVGNLALLLPPLAPIVVLAGRRGAWRGRQAVFWSAIFAWAAVWLVGQLAWASDELLRAEILPWFKWPIILQLCASALPLVALVAWPHRAAPVETAITGALDVTVLAFLTAFLYWCLIVAPGKNPEHSALALRMLATIGPLVRLAAVIGLLSAAWSARNSAWGVVYQRLAIGLGVAFVVLILMSLSAVRGDYQTGSPADIGWMLPFFFAAWAAATAPPSPPAARAVSLPRAESSSTLLLFLALTTVPIVGYGSNAIMPVGEAVGRMREIATAFTLVAGVGLVLMRLRIERLAASRANARAGLLATACEQAGELIVVVSRDSEIVYANEAFCRATGYSSEELRALPPNGLVAAESVHEIAGFNASIRARQVTRVTVTLQRSDRTTFHAACVAAPIVEADRVTHFVAVIRDVTDELRLREQLVRGERLAAIGEFLSGVAHELNNPLQAIIGTLELVLEQPLEDSLRDDLERTRFAAGRAGRIIRNLLAFVQQAPKERVLIDLGETVQATLSVRAYELQLAGIQVTEDYATVMPLVLANRDEIQQVLLNLVINAQQAMTDNDGARILSIRTHIVGNDAVVDVSDSGPGVPPAIAGKIFEPFFTTKHSSTGTGLGLSLSLAIATAHRGRLELVPTGRGSCFRLALPGAGYPGPLSLPTSTASSVGG